MLGGLVFSVSGDPRDGVTDMIRGAYTADTRLRSSDHSGPRLRIKGFKLRSEHSIAKLTN